MKFVAYILAIMFGIAMGAYLFDATQAHAQTFEINDTETVSTVIGDIVLNYTASDPTFCIAEIGVDCSNGYIWTEKTQWGTISSNAIYLNQADFDNAENSISPRDLDPNFIFILGTDLAIGAATFIYSDEISGLTVTLDFTSFSNGFSSSDNFWGLPTASDAVNYVTQGVQETGSNTIPIGSALVGVPLGFVIGRGLLILIKSAV